MTPPSLTTARGDARATTYAPPAARDALLAECIGNILAGKPLPAAVRPPAAAVERPGTIYIGISRILGAR
jgi:hypothetical protein